VRRVDLLYSGVLWMFVCCECCALSFSIFLVGLITCSEESYGSLSVDIFLFCQVEVRATGISQVQSSTKEVCLL